MSGIQPPRKYVAGKGLKKNYMPGNQKIFIEFLQNHFSNRSTVFFLHLE